MSDILNDQLIESKPVRLEKDGHAVCVVRVRDEIFAIGDTCTHSDASLAEGDVTKTAIECWLHGAEFDLRTGQALTLPATTAVPTYSVIRNADGVTIEI
ncbi:MAG: non-heme iron oxygenase ferredoxin subunit [Actinobacteria bacterium]|nr:non-heme iron oxygenase ferredoxin subunit [Actinomycetota bacterium]